MEDKSVENIGDFIRVKSRRQFIITTENPKDNFWIDRFLKDEK